MQDQTGHSFDAYFKRAVSPLVVLALLRGQSMYGYEISQQISIKTHKALSVSVLYPVLYRLEEQGYIAVTDTVVENGRARNYYTATEAGVVYLNEMYAQYLKLSEEFCSLVEGERKREAINFFE